MAITPISGYGTANFIVSTTPGQGNYTSLASAMAAASAPATIFLRTTVSENVTITPGVHIVGWGGLGNGSLPTIIGKVTMTGIGTSNISGIKLQTNGDAAVEVSGSNDSILKLTDCFIQVSGNVALNYSSSGTNSALELYNCNGNISTSTYFSCSGAGNLKLEKCIFNNLGNTTTACTVSGGTLSLNWSLIKSPITLSGTTANLNMSFSQIDTSLSNSTCLTQGSTTGTTHGCFCRFSEFDSGTASAISVSASSILTVSNIRVDSSNTNAITGSGTLQRGTIDFTGTSSTINTTTVTQLKSLPKSSPTIQRFTSGTAATYTTPANCQWIRIRMVGGGGGGAGTGSVPDGGAGGSGGNTTFSGGTLTAAGGTGGAANGGGTEGSGGTGTNGNVLNVSGCNGGPRWNNSLAAIGGYGGGSFFGQGGPGGEANGGTGKPGGGYGAGGGGGGCSLTSGIAGTGGGGGGYVEHIINSPAASYTYTVGTAGTAGAAGTSGVTGGAGIAGIIVVEEYYS